MKQLFTFVALALGFSPVFGQQPAQYSLFMMNKLNWNPAYAGLDNSLSATGVYRAQWAGLEGNPITQNVNVHMPLYILSSGIGINLENDELGAERRTTGTVSYNYQLPVGRRGLLAIGLSAGLAQRTLDGSKLRTPDGDYDIDASVIIHNDGLLPISQINASAATFGAGIYYYSERFEAGLAARNLSEPIVDLDAISLVLKRTFFFNAGGHFDLGGSLSLHPSLLARSDLAQTQTDIAAILQYNDNIFGGASFRGYNSDNIDAVAFIAGFKLSENVTLAYAYDLTLSALNQVSNGSHEVMINYNLNKRLGTGRPPKVIYNPRTL
ncbi:MAG: type IX secretion system membrane protein PorP/SprF [Lewinellaceae bacterium]|nr:type IX secretion system membrane protein PorP/SprF [Phaeodactylibacter sp.]MCB0616427.1 type IX secretion system membrane protein PorP/SprF [Phaeodactylibacter sp.]MCB9352311.1 type IX secretion system membrane protein PorP/SprF [Lewinellaceae bacterium]